MPIALISCKVSLHGRLTETLFYSLYYRLNGKLKVVLATPDKGRQSSKGVWESEWGSNERPTKGRLLASRFLDGVYIANVPIFMPPNFDPTYHGTVLGGIVRNLVELPLDIVRWYDDLKFSNW